MVSCTCPRCEGTGKEQMFQLQKLPAYSKPFEQVTWEMKEGWSRCSYCLGTGIVDGYGRSRTW